VDEGSLEKFGEARAEGDEFASGSGRKRAQTTGKSWAGEEALEL
jgi:hypothetical protein